jgi:hypothetical protein
MVLHFQHNEIPDGYKVIRVKGTNIYLHITENSLVFKNKMSGCFVVKEIVAIEILLDIDKEFPDKEIEIIDFKKAYEEHGLIENQIAYN